MEKLVRELLEEIGENPDREGLVKTPRRVAAMYEFLTSGYHTSLDSIVNQAIFEEEYDEMVCVTNIEMYSLCEHHLLPFTGVAHVAYLPDEKIIGLGRIAKVVETLAARPQLQENLGNEIADAIEAGLSPKGVLVVLEAKHQCVASRGARQPEVETVTSSARGVMQQIEHRQEAMGLISK